MSKNLDLGPDDYRKQDRDGHWVTPDDPKALAIGIATTALMLGWIFWNRQALAADPFWLILGTSVVVFPMGIFVALLLKRIGY